MYNDKIISLKNGLEIGVLEFGDLNSNDIVFYLHGFPGCRFAPLFTERFALKNRIKIISIDRLGYGNSSYYKDETILNFGDIFTNIVDTLQIDTFKVLAVSGGSPYLASVCYALKKRVKKAVVVSGLSPLDNEDIFRNLNIINKFFLKFGQKFPKITSLMVSFVAKTWKMSTKFMLLWLKTFMSKSDRNLLNTKDNHKYLKKVYNEAFKNGVNGVKKDFELYLKPWNINFDEIMTPVEIFHGNDDPYVTFQMGEYLNSLYKNSKFHEIDGEGHLAILNNAKLVVDAICNDN